MTDEQRDVARTSMSPEDDVSPNMVGMLFCRMWSCCVFTSRSFVSNYSGSQSHSYIEYQQVIKGIFVNANLLDNTVDESD